MDDFERVTLVNCPVVTLHAEVFKDKLRSFFQYDMVETLEIKFVKRGFFNDQTDATLVIVLWQIYNELSQLFTKRCWQSLGCNG